MKQHTTKLIEGEFSTEKARLLLIELLRHKINFHGMEKFSNEMRFGKDHERSEEAIHRLSAETDKLIHWLDTLPSHAKLEINGTILIQIIP